MAAAASTAPATTSTAVRSFVVGSSALSSELSLFFESAIHLVLHGRSLYPASLFESRRAYGVCVHTSRHPLLNQYIKQLADDIQAWMVQGEMQRVVLVVLEPPRTEANQTAAPKCVERFVFELCLMQPAAAASAAALSPSDTALLHEQFAAILTRLSTCDGHFTAKRSKNCTWSVLLYTNHSTPMSVADSTASAAARPSVASSSSVGAWQSVPLCSHDSAAAASSPSTPFLDFHPNANRIMPLKSVRTDLLHMEVYCEAAGAPTK